MLEILKYLLYINVDIVTNASAELQFNLLNITFLGFITSAIDFFLRTWALFH